MRKKCSICGREIELTRNDAEEVFVFREGKTICRKCYLKERYRNDLNGNTYIGRSVTQLEKERKIWR